MDSKEQQECKRLQALVVKIDKNDRLSTSENGYEDHFLSLPNPKHGGDLVTCIFPSTSELTPQRAKAVPVWLSPVLCSLQTLLLFNLMIQPDTWTTSAFVPFSIQNFVQCT